MVGRHAAPVGAGFWVYCGGDYLVLHHFESLLGNRMRLSLADDLEQVAGVLRGRFIEWIGECGRVAGFSLAWQMTSTCGHSVTTSALFLNICYLEALKRMLGRRGGEDILVICDDWFMLRAVEQNLQRWGICSRRLRGWQFRMTSDAGLSAARWGGHWAKGMFTIVQSIWASRASRSSASDKVATGRRAIINTCVDESCFGGERTFRDRYYPGLERWLEASGWRVTVIPWLFNIKRSRGDAFRWLRGSSTQMLVLEDHMRLRDIPSAAFTVLSASWLRGRKKEFGEIHVSSLWQREKVHDSSMAGRVKFLLYGPAIRRWLRVGNRCDVYIDFFENMPSERPPLRAFRRFAPSTLTVGYRHMGGLAADALNFHVSSHEAAAGLLPDCVVANSRESMRALIGQGIPRDAVRLGPALRYDYLLKPLHPIPRATSERDACVLGLLPLDIGGAIEILAALVALKDEFEALHISVRLKAHPMCPQAKLEQEFGRAKLPRSWQWTTAAVQELFPDAIVVVGYESVLLEAAACAVPFASLRRETGLTLNPLAAWFDRFPGCRNLTRNELLQLVRTEKASPECEPWRLELARTIREDLGPVDETRFEAFVAQRAMQVEVDCDDRGKKASAVASPASHCRVETFPPGRP